VFPSTRIRQVILTAVALGVVCSGGTAAFAAKQASPKRDNAPPSVAFVQPAAGSTLSGNVTLSGSASDNAGLSSIQVSVDGNTWSTANGMTSWSANVNTAAYGDGSHTLYAKATDTSGNSSTSALSVSFANGDTTPPSVTFSAPAASSTVGGSVSVTGTASDNTSVASVAVQVDGGAWQTASGTSSWSWTWNTNGAANGTHTLTARATDSSGNTSTSNRSFTVSNTTADTSPPAIAIANPASGATVAGSVSVSGSASDNVSVSKVEVQVDGGSWTAASGTNSWSWSWNSAGVSNGSHTLTARATDSAGNTSTTSATLNVSNSTGGTSAPSTQGSWVSPEGVHINVNTTGPWTINLVYSILKANALDLATVGPHYTINVQDTYGDKTTVSSTLMDGTYSGYTATTTLYGAGGTSMADRSVAHEYGHAWSYYYYYLVHNGSWLSYENVRWTTSDGSTTLATDGRTNGSYTWQVSEIIADDYRLLFGTQAAISEQPSHLNTDIPDPRSVPGLATWLLNNWR